HFPNFFSLPPSLHRTRLFQGIIRPRLASAEKILFAWTYPSALSCTLHAKKRCRMSDEKRPANLAGMFIGGQVPFELVGLIFKAFYSAGINPSSFELAPIYTDADVADAVEKMGRKLSANGAVPQITDQSAPKRKVTRS